jgi:hypothetical protein
MIGINSNTALAVPFFNVGEGIDVVVDKDDKLHIFTTAIGTARGHQDSLEYTWQFTVGSETMGWAYQPTAWPYMCDFYGDGTGAWGMHVIDSLGTEGPSSTQTGNGFASNPWGSPDPAQAVGSDSRLQISRTYDGEYLLYSWAESDTTLTTSQLKWNEFPDVHQRALRLCDDAVSTDEFVVTAPATGFNPKVRNKAYFHYMNSTSKAEMSTATSAQFTVAYTVSNNTDTDPIIATDNYYANVIATHNFPSSACGATITTGLGNYATEVSNSIVYPNPAANEVNVALNLTNAGKISVDIYNAIGQVVASTTTDGVIGKNTVN